eukprot:647771-Pelagomonas_calceolata.AAC.1
MTLHVQMTVQVVVCLQLLVLRDGMQLSEDAAAALATPSSHFRLPARLTSMLQIPPAFVQARKTQAEDGASVWWYMIQRPVAWFLNRPRDVSDIQWRDFRGGLGPLAAAMAAFVVLSRLVSQGGCAVSCGQEQRFGYPAGTSRDVRDMNALTFSVTICEIASAFSVSPYEHRKHVLSFDLRCTGWITAGCGKLLSCKCTAEPSAHWNGSCMC